MNTQSPLDISLDRIMSHLFDNDAESKYNSITAEQYEEFQKAWIFYILKEYRYGQAFCEHFGLGTNNVLYHFRDEDISRRWINQTYLKK